jgi:hypothetical protein
MSKIKLFCRDAVFGTQEFFHGQLGRVRKLWTDPEETFVEQGVELGFVATVRVTVKLTVMVMVRVTCKLEGKIEGKGRGRDRG